MVCIYCGGDTKVTNSRLQKKLNHIWRRRHCLDCGAIFTTQEGVSAVQSLVVIGASSSAPFQRDKLFLSLHNALKHRKTALQDATALTDTVWSKLLPFIHNASLERAVIISTAASVLNRFDKAAATSYQAYHPL